MKKKHTLLIIAGLCACGWFSGMGARHFTMLQPGTEANSVGSVSQESESVALHPGLVVAKSAGHSTDTLETLAALDGDVSYSRLSLWLVDAVEEDIAKYWENYRKGKRRKEITALIFLNWTRLNPQAAIAAAGSEDEGIAWQTWACHDPQGAFSAAATPEQVENVVRGLGQFHPKWLREHFNEIPEAARGAGLSAMAEWGDSEDPMEALKFADQHDMGFDNAAFRTLFSKDPWAALDWAKQTKWDLRELVTKMAEESPENLARVAAQSPSGEARRLLEAALFSNLVKTDPEAALAQAKATDVPRIAAERLGAVGLSLVKTDPAKAFEMAEDIFTIFPRAMQAGDVLWSPDGRSSEGGGALPEVARLMGELISREPGKVLDILAARPWEKDLSDHALSGVCYQWARKDMAAYGEWVGRQSDPALRETGITWAFVEFQSKGKYRDAVDWALSLPGEDRMSDFQFIFDRWNRRNPAEVLEWLDSADLPADEKRKIQTSLEP